MLSALHWMMYDINQFELVGILFHLISFVFIFEAYNTHIKNTQLCERTGGKRLRENATKRRRYNMQEYITLTLVYWRGTRR